MRKPKYYVSGKRPIDCMSRFVPKLLCGVVIGKLCWLLLLGNALSLGKGGDSPGTMRHSVTFLITKVALEKLLYPKVLTLESVNVQCIPFSISNDVKTIRMLRRYSSQTFNQTRHVDNILYCCWSYCLCYVGKCTSVGVSGLKVMKSKIQTSNFELVFVSVVCTLTSITRSYLPDNSLSSSIFTITNLRFHIMNSSDASRQSD